MSMQYRPSRILVIEPLDDGGLAHYAFNLVTALAKRVEVSLLTSANYELRGENTPFPIHAVMFRLAGYLVKRFPSLAKETGVLSLLRRALKLIEYPYNAVHSAVIAAKKRIEIAHFQTVNFTELLMILVFKLIGIRVVFTIHNVTPRHGKLRSYHRLLFRFMYGLCDRLIIHSQKGRDEVISLFSVDPKKISVIPHGDYKFFLPEESVPIQQAKSGLGIPYAAKTILFFGAIRPNKGLEVLLRAFPIVKAAIPDARLIIAGEPCEDYNRYRRIIEEKGFSKSVLEILTYIPNSEVSRYFSASDVVVLPYHEITQSGVLQIAYAFSKPVVATAIGGFIEAVEDGQNGFLVAPGDPAALAGKIVAVLAEQAAMEGMGRRSRELADTAFSWDSIGDRTVLVYADILAGCGA